MRQSTILTVRSLAIIGQSMALIVAFFVFNVEMAYDIAFSLIILSLFANIILYLLFPPGHYISNQLGLSLMLFDLLQLSALLFISGGINNPFALMLIFPAVFAAIHYRVAGY